MISMWVWVQLLGLFCSCHIIRDTSPAYTLAQGSIPPAVITAQKENTLFSFLGTPCIPGVYRRAIEKSKDHRD